MGRPEQRTRKREAAGKTCRQMENYMVKLPKVAEELDGGGYIRCPGNLETVRNENRPRPTIL